MKPADSVQLSLILYIVGAALLVTYSCSTKRETSPDEQDQLVSKAPPTAPLRIIISLGALLLYYSLSSSLVFQLFSACSQGFTHKVESIVCFGCTFTAMSLYSACKGRSDASDTAITTTLLLFGLALTGLLFPTSCVVEETTMSESLMSVRALVPMAGSFLGGACGLLTCEVLYLASTLPYSTYSYSLIVAFQGVWGAVYMASPGMASHCLYVSVLGGLTLCYTCTALYIHMHLKSQAKRVLTAIRRSNYGDFALSSKTDDLLMAT